MSPASVRRVRTMLGKDLRLGPRSPLVVWAIAIPILLTLLVRGVFGDLLDPAPRLGVVDHDGSSIAARIQQLDGIDVTVLDDEATLRDRVGDDHLDAGLILPGGFDDAVRAGARPQLELFVGGESLASNRILIAVTTLDLVRGVAGDRPPVEVELVELGEPGVPLDLRMLPLIVVMAVAIAGGMLPAAAIVEEKEQRTLDAVLVTPLTMREALAAKGLFGVTLALSAGVVTLAANGVLTTAPTVSLVAIGLGAIMMAQIGLLLGAWAPDTNTLFAAWKGGAIVLIFPFVFFLWPQLPMWIARFGPAYYFLRPVYAATVEGARLSDVAVDLVIAAAICMAMVPLVGRTGAWLEARLAAGRATTAATADTSGV